MIVLLAGLLLWCSVHLFPAVAVTARPILIARYGQSSYRSFFAVLILCSIVLMVFGWRSVEPGPVYQTFAWGRGAAYVLVFFTFILFAAAKRRTNIRRYLRHPQLTGVFLWSVGHLLANGDDRSLVLFITLALWSVLEIVLINRRTGTWIKPEPVPVSNDVMTIIIGTVLYGVLFWAHPYLSGIKLV